MNIYILINFLFSFQLFDEEEIAEGERLFHYKWPLYKRKGLKKPGAGF